MTVLIDSRQSILEVAEDMENFINGIVKGVLNYEEWDQNFEISISFVDNQEIQALNKKFRNIDKPTDVLSFPMLEFEDESKDGPEEHFEGEQPLGDIVISVEKAIEQAEEYGHSKEREIAFLLVHGMLHLLGYDHEDGKDEILMFKKQDDILNILKISR